MLDAWFNSPSITVPQVSRSDEEQARVDAATRDLALYHYDSCMFCARVRKAMAALGLNIELRNIHGDREHYRALVTHGGRTTVPCLRIGPGADGEARWMYESADIIRYLVEQFGSTDTQNRD